MDGDGPAIMARLISSAKKGEPWAVRLTMERLLPRRERRIEVNIGRLEKAEDVARAVADIIGCAARGELTIEEAHAFMRLLEQQRKSIETSDIAARLELLEQGDAVAGVRRRFGFEVT